MNDMNEPIDMQDFYTLDTHYEDDQFHQALEDSKNSARAFEDHQARVDAFSHAVNDLDTYNHTQEITLDTRGEYSAIQAYDTQDHAGFDGLAIGIATGMVLCHNAWEDREERLDTLAHEPNDPFLESENELLTEVLEHDMQILDDGMNDDDDAV